MAYAIIETEAIAAALAAIVASIDPSGQASRKAAETVRALADDGYREPDASAFLYLLADTMEYSVPSKMNNSLRANG